MASSPKSLSIRVDEEGGAPEVIRVKVGLKTRFIPFRRPAVGEKVKVDYSMENGDKFGNTVQVIGAGTGKLVCCGDPMELLTENTTDAAQEKHVPVIENVEGGIRVKVGSVDHPMEEKHFIEWIEVRADQKDYRQFLSPGDKPEAFFPIEADQITARESCNLHGLWKAE